MSRPVLEASVELGTSGSLLLDRALQRWVRFPAVYASHCRNLGRHGSADAGRMLVAAADRSASVAERLLVGMLRDAGISGWECAFPVDGYLADVAFPAAGVAGGARRDQPRRAVRRHPGATTIDRVITVPGRGDVCETDSGPER